MNTFSGSNASSSLDASQPTLLAFDELQSRLLSLSVRATALVFEDPVSRRLLELIERIAPTDATVLIIGETGTGKELVARHVHALSKRSNNVFGALNCAALSENLIESELFGHEKVKTRLGGTYPAFNFAKYGSRYLGAFVYRFNRRFHLETITTRLIVAAATIGPQPATWIRQVEASC